MGGRVTHTGSGELARARRLKKALESGGPPAFVPADCVPPEKVVSKSELSWKTKESAEIRCRYLEQAFQNMLEAMSIVDDEQGVVCVNEAFRRMFGYEASEALGRPLEALIMPPDREAESRWISERVGRGESITLETERRGKDGRLLEVSVSTMPLSTGTKAAICTVFRDVSLRKRAEALSSALYRVAEKSSTAHDLQQFFAAVHSIVDELMYAGNFAVALVDPVTELLSFPYFVNEQEAAPAAKKLGRGITEYVLRTGEALLATGERLKQLVSRGEVELNGTRAVEWMGVPLKVGNNTFGALVVQNYSKQARFCERDRDILSFVSQQVASAIENKRTEQALRRS